MSKLTFPPFVLVDGIPNFRDIGGYHVQHTCSTAKSVRRSFVFRSAQPSKVTADGIKTLQSLGVTHFYDLRSRTEIDREEGPGWTGLPAGHGCERVFAPVFLDRDYSPEAIAIRFRHYARDGTEGFTRAYKDILESAPPSYKKILQHIAYEPSKPLTIHCTAGKDRTGVICAIILSLCGVPDEVVAYEYALTEIGLGEFKDTIVDRLTKGALKGDIRGAENMISARAENMLSTLEMIRKEFGGPEQYVVQQCGLAMDDVERIRRNLLVETPAIHDPLNERRLEV